MAKFEQLQKPGQIGSMTLKNRMIMAPMGSNFAEADGHCGERIQAFYETRAKGGAAMLTMGVCSIAYPAGTAEPFQVGISRDDFIPGLKQLTDRVHKHGAKIAIQLQHAGKTAVRDLAEGRDLWVPSMPPPMKTDMMQSLTQAELGAFIRPKAGGNISIRVMDKADITQMVEWFAAAALRAKTAGFDGIELHAAHTYIIAGFLSPYYNQREDEYGGCLENRARLLLEVIKAVRPKVGADFPLWLRLDAAELRTPGGITIDDCIAVAKLVEQAGLDAVSISAYANTNSGDAFTEAPLVQKPAGFLDWAAAVSKSVTIPVIAVGRLEPELANRAISEGKCGFVAMGRKLLADAELPNKILENRPDDIRPCIYCYACVSQIFINQRVKCAVNPFTGNEAELNVIMTDKPKHILVIGGGPGGMEAAKIASERGHKVTLLERSGRLGGTLFFAAMAYPENGKLLDYLKNQLAQTKVDIKLNTEATIPLLQQLAPDEVIVATGAQRNLPDIAGAKLPHVWSGDELRQLMTGEANPKTLKKLGGSAALLLKLGAMTGITGNIQASRKLSNLWMPLGKHISIIGGGLVGLELAEFLAARGRQVTVLEPGRDLGSELSIVRRWRVLHELKLLGVNLINQLQLDAIHSKHIDYTDKEGVKQTQAVDTVIMALGTEPDNRLAHKMTAAGFSVTNIGDSDEIGYIEGALKSATLTAVSI